MVRVRSERAAKAEPVEGKLEGKAEDKAGAVGWVRAATAFAPRVERPCRMRKECHVRRSNVPNADHR